MKQRCRLTHMLSLVFYSCSTLFKLIITMTLGFNVILLIKFVCFNLWLQVIPKSSSFHTWSTFSRYKNDTFSLCQRVSIDAKSNLRPEKSLWVRKVSGRLTFLRFTFQLGVCLGTLNTIGPIKLITNYCGTYPIFVEQMPVEAGGKCRTTVEFRWNR